MLSILAGCGEGIFTRSRADTGPDAAAPDTIVPTADLGLMMETGEAATMRSLNIAAGADGILQLETGVVTVRSMSFDQDVVVTIEIADSSAVGPIGRAYRVSVQPVGAHSRNPIRLALTLDAVTESMRDQIKLSTYQVRVPVGIWLAAPGQQYNAADHTLWAEFTSLDTAPITFAILRTCANNLACDQRQNCNTNLCQ
ncbi:MAG TPA: hypothetical protein VFH73_28345 [Polyangia bacterium]|nr:hypothetical protein [Polyangia bacterium]